MKSVVNLFGVEQNEPKSDDVHVKIDDKETLKQYCEYETEPETEDLPSSGDAPMKMKVEQVNLGVKDNDGSVSSTKIIKANQTKIHLDLAKKKYSRYVDSKPQELPGKIPVASVAERTCIICGRAFEKIIQMKLHLVRHTTIFKNLNFEEKMKRSEDISRGVTCLDCGKVDGNAGNIKKHIAQVHYQLHNTIDFTNMENYDLSEGGTTLKGSGIVARKERTLQTLLCEFCNKVFNDYDRSNLNKHIRFVHKGIRRKKKEVTSLNGSAPTGDGFIKTEHTLN